MLGRRQVRKKMTCEEFLRNNRGINNGENLPPDFLQSIYTSIVRNEIRTSSEAESGAFEVRYCDHHYGTTLVCNTTACGSRWQRGPVGVMNGVSQVLRHDRPHMACWQ
jgi:hypothetical protein